MVKVNKFIFIQGMVSNMKSEWYKIKVIHCFEPPDTHIMYTNECINAVNKTKPILCLQ